jgi:hypothetical protein
MSARDSLIVDDAPLLGAPAHIGFNAGGEQSPAAGATDESRDHRVRVNRTR